MEHMSKILMIKKVMKHIGFHYLLTKIQLLYFDSFGIEYIPQEILNKIKDKYVAQNLFRIQEDDFIMCRFYGKTCRKKFETFHKTL